MDWNTLPPDEKSTMLAYTLATRGALIKLAQAFNTLQDLDTAYNAAAKASNAKLDAGTIIPDQTTLAGAQALTSTDISQWMTSIEAMLATNNNNAWRLAFIRAGGVANTMQSA